MRTLDPARGQRDPGDPAAWPCDRAALRDDLWALALTLLPRAADAWRALESESLVVGREYEKWRPLLAVARVLADHGLRGIEPNIRSLMLSYSPLDADPAPASDESIEVLRALVGLLEHNFATATEQGVSPEDVPRVRQSTLEITNEMIRVALELFVPEASLAGLTTLRASRRITRVMARFRFRTTRAPTHQRERGWAIVPERVLQLARAYGVTTSLPPLPAKEKRRPA